MIDELLFNKSDITEFVGCAKLDTIVLCVPNVTDELHSAMNLDKNIKALGLVSSRTGAAGQILAVDEALKSTNSKIISVELPRDTKGWGGHGNYIVFGSQTYSDVRKACEIALSLIDRNAGEVYISDAGHLECAFTPNSSEAVLAAFGVKVGEAFGFLAASPAAIGLLCADKALKSSSVSLVKFMSPSVGTSHSNEVIICFTGSTDDVKNAVIEGRRVALNLLKSMGSVALSPSEPYILE